MINKFERQKSLETKIEGRIIMGYINNVDQVRRSFIGLGCNWAITSCTYRKDGMDTTTPLSHQILPVQPAPPPTTISTSTTTNTTTPRPTTVINSQLPHAILCPHGAAGGVVGAACGSHCRGDGEWGCRGSE